MMYITSCYAYEYALKNIKKEKIVTLKNSK